MAGDLESPLRPTQPPDLLDDENDKTTNYISMEMSVMQRDDLQPTNDDEEEEASQAEASLISSVMTADGIHDVTGFYCVCMVILIGDMSRGVMFPSMWPLVESLGGSQVLLGYSVAAFSFGRVLVNPLFGSWSHQIGYSHTLLMASIILLFGTFVYAQIQNIGKPEFLILAQTLLGIGSGTLGVTRAFVADVTAKRNRTMYMAWVTAVQYAGFTVTPFFGALFNKLFGDKEYQYGIFRMNMFTAPAYFMSLIVLLTIVILLVYFKDRQRITTFKEQTKKSRKRVAIDEVANATTFIGLTVYDCCILGCMLLNVSTKGSIASFETLGIAIAQSYFDMLASRAGAIVACCGTVGVISLLFMGSFSKYCTDIQLITGGMIVMASGILSLTWIERNSNEGIHNPSWRYAMAIFMIYSVGYPIGHTAVIGLFSKIVGRRPQGTLLGWFASAGSIARMFFPIMSGYIASYKDMDTLFILLSGVLIASTAFVFYFSNTLSLLSS